MNIYYESQIKMISLPSAHRVRWVYSGSKYWLGRLIIHTFHRWVSSKVWQAVKICFNRSKECALNFLEIFWRNAWWTLWNYKKRYRLLLNRDIMIRYFVTAVIISTNPFAVISVRYKSQACYLERASWIIFMECVKVSQNRSNFSIVRIQCPVF